MDNIVGVTGGSSFFGRHLCKLMRDQGVEVLTPLKHGWDFTSREDTETWTSHIRGAGVRKIINLAGYNGGIQFNKYFPFDIFYKNTQMGLNLINAAVEHEMDKILSVVASCAYPSEVLGWDRNMVREVMLEEDFLNGPPHDSVSCHGYAKRNLQLASYYAHKQYGLNAVCVCPTTMYGPGDSFEVSRTKVMGGLIRKFYEAKKAGDAEVKMIGTGAALREFIYVEDAAKYILLSLLSYDDSSMPLNIGTGQEISIKELAEKVARAVKYTGTIKWGSSGEDGQLRKKLDTTRQKQILGEITLTPLDEGIQKTVDWYNENRSNS